MGQPGTPPQDHGPWVDPAWHLPRLHLLPVPVRALPPGPLRLQSGPRRRRTRPGGGRPEPEVLHPRRRTPASAAHQRHPSPLRPTDTDTEQRVNPDTTIGYEAEPHEV